MILHSVRSLTFQGELNTHPKLKGDAAESHIPSVTGQVSLAGPRATAVAHLATYQPITRVFSPEVFFRLSEAHPLEVNLVFIHR